MARAGVIYGLAAYLWWGVVPVYYKAIAIVPPLEVLAHRVVWSLPLLMLLLIRRKRLGAAWNSLRDRRTAITLVATTLIIAVNWVTFIWAVTNGHVLEASLGYFINPLINVLLGFVFLGERLRRLQLLSVGLACAGVLYLTWGYGELPWIALLLAVSFGFYGLLRKTVRADALTGLTVEITMLSPLALGYLVLLAWRGVGAFGTHSIRLDGLLLLAGAITASPLIWFANAARRLRLSTVGFLQYLAPSLQFTLAVAFFGETFTPNHAVSFGLIWTALAIYSVDAVVTNRRMSRIYPLAERGA